MIINKFIPELFLYGLATNSIDCVIYNLNGEVVAATDYAANLMGFTQGKELIGYSYYQTSQKEIEKFCKEDFLETAYDDLLNCCKEIQKIISNVLENKKVAQYLDFSPYKKVDTGLNITLTPLFINEELVGIRSISNNFCPYGINDYLSETSAPNSQNMFITNTNIKLPFGITPQQHAILFLALRGFSQTEIAKLLKLSRGTVASIFRDSLCPKFEIPGGSMRLLLEHIKKYQLDRIFPQFLYSPQVISLD